jgi:FixJ family two-component response regulator
LYAAPGETVVIVDDDPGLLTALKFGLELEGYAVHIHAEPASVRAEGLPKHHGCLVIDYRLGGLDGLHLLERLRDSDVDLPAIIVTSHPRKDLAVRAAALGAALVEKPLLGDVLVSAIRTAMAQRPLAVTRPAT